MPPQQNSPTPLAESTPPQIPHGGTKHPLVLLIGALAAILAISGAVYLLLGSAAQEPVKIGLLSMRQFNDVAKGLREEMARLGYTDAQFIDIATNPSPTLAQDIDVAVRRLIEEDVDAIWASLEQQAKGAVDITKMLGRQDIPIVFMTRFHDPVEYGIIESFTSSGNNATGVATNLEEIVARTLQFFKDIDPSIKKVGVFSEGFMVPGVGEEFFAALLAEAPRFGMEIVQYKTSVPPPEVEAEFYRVADSIQKGDIDALFHIPGHFYNLQEAGEGKLSLRLGIPMFAPYEDLPNGGMFTYSDDFGESGRASAVILDKVLRGAKPSDIPVEYGAGNVLTLMMSRAREAGITFPESMLYLAKNKFEDDSVFEKDSLNR